MKFQGRLSEWQDSKGFGFVQPNGGGERSFVHISEFENASRRPIAGDLIIYQQIVGQKGSEATNIQLASDRKKKQQPDNPKKRNRIGNGYLTLARLVTPVFVLALIAAAWFDKVAIEIVMSYAVMSVITFIAYWWDKSAAEADRWRTQENTLHMFGVLGGWPGALYAQVWLRHKSSKHAFSRMFWLSIVVNWLLLYWLSTPKGAMLIQQISVFINNTINL